MAIFRTYIRWDTSPSSGPATAWIWFLAPRQFQGIQPGYSIIISASCRSWHVQTGTGRSEHRAAGLGLARFERRPACGRRAGLSNQATRERAAFSSHHDRRCNGRDSIIPSFSVRARNGRVAAFLERSTGQNLNRVAPSGRRLVTADVRLCSRRNLSGDR